jgi:SAM-dependent methyltransferase
MKGAAGRGPRQGGTNVDIRKYNREAWDLEVEKGNRWTVPAGPETIAEARRGRWEIVLTPVKPVPRGWFPPLADTEVLCLASGGGQQGPILAAAGARVTVLDNSPKQLDADRMVAARESLPLRAVEGDMADLSMFAPASFGLVVHPISNCFAPRVRPVWREAFRVLRPGGVLVAGFVNPAVYLFDRELSESKGILQARHRLPYSDLESLTEEERGRSFGKGEPLEFSHTLEDQLDGQLEAGFVITGFYEDSYPPEADDPLARLMPLFLATRAVKPARAGEAEIR